ncbi:NAD-binding protein [Halobacillus yeomjeoni]|uniref:potassium channel family protein n=1 Tax=Halobacillus yeomjeoni TaxID=311194 RepID=UPI001CD40272|nr:potassium channel protein [Halobacillus yeomjeoni]MCA0983132.1 NAD-binding protein [Halobacillus yeomjeoni]
MGYKKIFLSLILLHTILFIGTSGYMVMEDLSIFEALWLTIVSVLTIGYGDLVPQTTGGKWLTLIIIPLAIGLATYMLAQFAGAIISGKLSNEMRRRKMTRDIEHLHDHVIICGYGRVGQQVYQQLNKEDKSIVIIDYDEATIEHLPENVLHVLGNATVDEILKKAGIERAKGIIITLPSDADNVFITLTAKGMNSDLYAIARAERDQSAQKMYRAGADYVTNTSNIGGRQMATAMTKPMSVDYMETILYGLDTEDHIEEVLIEEGSSLIDRTVKEVRDKYRVTIFAIKRDEEVISNPEDSTDLKADDLLIVFASDKQIHRLRTHSTNK